MQSTTAFAIGTPITSSKPRRGLLLASAAAFGLLGACGEPLDADLRDLGNGFDTTEAALNPPDRPRPDARGVISYPNYQVVVAQRGDTMRTIAGRVGIEAETLARYNGISPDTELRRDEIIALPSRVADSAGATGALDVTSIAIAAIDRAGPTTVTTLPPAATATPPAPAPQSGTEPVRHQVQRGETAYSIARLYNVPVRNVAEWNGLGADLAVREGSYLLIPVVGASPPAASIVPPGAGSVAPEPPSAATPLPAVSPPAAAAAAAATPPAPDVGTQAQPAASSAPFVRPVQGSIIRAYAPGRNEGIDIGAASGTEVRAAAAGTVAAVTTNTDGIQIVVIKHADNLLTVYTHLDNLSVVKDAAVSQGQVIGRVRADDPSFLHFEVRRGMESADPGDFLP